jgi:prepilin-type processing-associated H-X9-DG protein
LFENADSISELFDGEPPAEAELEPASMFSRFTDRLVHPSSLSRVDVLAGVAILAVFASILLPAISHSRFQSRIESCKHNLCEVGTAMLVYSDLNNAKFVDVSNASLASSNAGIFAPVLKSAGFVDDDSLFACAGRLESEPPRIPTLQQIRSAEGDRLEELKRRMGGHFGYALGFFKSGKYSAPRNDGSAHTILFADMPSADLPGRGSKNHNGKGQNCFFADGHVDFIPTHTFGDDAIYENDLGIVGPGIGEQDNVIAPCHLPPVEVKYELHDKKPL